MEALPGTKARIPNTLKILTRCSAQMTPLRATFMSATSKLQKIQLIIQVSEYLRLEYNIKGCITAAKGYEVNHPKSLLPHYKVFPGLDHEGFDLSIYFEQAC